MIIKRIQSVRGMHDCLPQESVLFQKIEKTLITVFNSYGYNEIRFPIVEYTQLFKRSIGHVTDIIEKEMYSFNDQSGNNLTLRPEGTSGCVRAGIESSLFYNKEQRLWYLGPMFRYDRPQKGRYRQFHQCSVESFGYLGPDIDAELILITVRCWKELGISQYLTLELNSIGLLSSRIIYCKELVNFLNKNLQYLDHDSIRRLHSNPLRILDTKNSEIQKLLIDAPMLKDYIDDESLSHFNKLCKLLDLFNISYIVNPYLVRGLDYYNRTVFEWVTNNSLKRKQTICAGGRYDDLVKGLGGRSTPAIGFSIGLERVLLLMKTINSSKLNIDIFIHLYILYTGEGSQKYAMLLSECIREKLPNLRLMVNYSKGNLKKQLNQAIKNNSNFALIIDENTILSNIMILKNLHSGQKNILKYNEVINKLKNLFNTN